MASLWSKVSLKIRVCDGGWTIVWGDSVERWSLVDFQQLHLSTTSIPAFSTPDCAVKAISM